MVAVLVAVVAFWVGQLGLAEAWTTSRGDGATVAVIDTGVDDDHPDLTGRVLPGAEFPDLGTGGRDLVGHGTEVAALVAGRHGVAPEAEVLPVKLTGNSADADAAVRWAVDRGAQVINMSLGGSYGSYGEALRYAAERDVLVVVAAGNTGVDQGVTALARTAGALAVSAVDRNGLFRPEVSVSGPEIALAAPGVDIATSRGERSGTSYAAAIVSGTAALVRARYPELTAPEVAELLETTAREAGPPGRDPQYGFGVVDPVRALAGPPPRSPAASGTSLGAPAGVCAALLVGSVLIRRRAKRMRDRSTRSARRPSTTPIGRNRK
ncbi:S8 family serine peptidase [Actinosynnema sp. NPDC002837]